SRNGFAAAHFAARMQRTSQRVQVVVGDLIGNAWRRSALCCRSRYKRSGSETAPPAPSPDLPQVVEQLRPRLQAGPLDDPQKLRPKILIRVANSLPAHAPAGCFNQLPRLSLTRAFSVPSAARSPCL